MLKPQNVLVRIAYHFAKVRVANAKVGLGTEVGARSAKVGLGAEVRVGRGERGVGAKVGVGSAKVGVRVKVGVGVVGKKIKKSSVRVHLDLDKKVFLP